MGKPPIIHLDCGVDISESYYNPSLPRHKCSKRISEEELKALGATMTQGYTKDHYFPSEHWEYNGRKLIMFLASSTNPADTYLYDSVTGEMLTLEDLKNET